MGYSRTYLMEAGLHTPTCFQDISSVSATSEEMVRVRWIVTVIVGVGGKGRRGLMAYRGRTQPTLPFLIHSVTARQPGWSFFSSCFAVLKRYNFRILKDSV